MLGFLVSTVLRGNPYLISCVPNVCVPTRERGNEKMMQQRHCVVEFADQAAAFININTTTELTEAETK